MPGIISDLDGLILESKKQQASLAVLTFDELAIKHGAWLDLYSIGQSISYLAEKLDSTYQAQFAAPADDLDFHYVLTDPPDDGPLTWLESRREELFKDATDDGCG